MNAVRKLGLIIAILLLGTASALARNPFHIPHGGGNIPPPTPPAPTAQLVANPTTIIQGNSTTLSWSSTNANSCTGTGFNTGNAVSGSVSASPITTTGYSLNCSGLGGTTTASATVTVTGAPAVTASLTANPTQIAVGDSSNLSWSSTNATSCTGTGFATGGATSGTQFISPTNTTGYSVSCTGPGGQATGNASVTVQTGGVASGNCASGATADGCVIFAGSTKTLVDGGAGVWSFENATSGVDGAYTRVLRNGSLPSATGVCSFVGSSQYGDAIMLASDGVYVRGWQRAWYKGFPGTSTCAGDVAAPSFTTTNDPGRKTVAAGSGASALGIGTPTNNIYSQANLTITADQLPTNGTITLADGVTPVTAGQTLAIAQLTGLQFIPNAGKVYTQDSSFSYLVLDSAQQGVIGTASLSVKPNGLWADPVIAHVNGGGVEYNAALPQPAAIGDIVDVRINNTSGGTFASGKTFMTGHTLLTGTVQKTDSLCARATGSGACLIYVQMDWKAANEDNSVRHAILSFNSDTSIASSATRDFMISKCGGGGGQPSCPSAPTAAADNATLAAGAEFAGGSLTYASGGTGTDNFSCKSILANANAGVGGSASVQPRTTTTWLNGPVIKSYSAMGLVNSGRLKLQCDVYSRSDGSVVTDVIVDNGWLRQGGKTDSVFSFSTTQDSFTQATVKEFLYGRFKHTIASASTPQEIGAQYFQFDVAYLIATGAIPDYDQSTGINPASLTGFVCGDGLHATGCFTLNNASVDGVGNVNNFGNMATRWGDAGSRFDIGPLMGWQAAYIMSGQDPTAFSVMLGNSTFAANVAWHYIDESTGVPINGNTYASWPNTPGFANGDPCDQGLNVCSNGSPVIGFYVDGDFPNAIGHHPAMAYFPYLITGSHFFMEEEVSFANQVIMDAFRSYGSTGNTEITGHYPAKFMGQFFTGVSSSQGPGNSPGADAAQLRQTAWSLRTAAQGAYIIPDSHPLKSFIVSQTQAGTNGWLQAKVSNKMDLAFGQLQGTFTDQWEPNPGFLSGFSNSYFMAALNYTAALGIPGASASARRLLQHHSNFGAGFLIHGQQGFPSYDGGPYFNGLVCNSIFSCDQAGFYGVGGFPATDSSKTPANTWRQLFGTDNTSGGWKQVSPGSLSGTFPTFTTNQGEMQVGCANFQLNQGGVFGGYPHLRLMELTGAIKWSTPTSLAWNLHAWANDFTNIAQCFRVDANAFNQGFPGILAGLSYTNEWAYVPQLPSDGKYLDGSKTIASDNGGNATLVCTTDPCVALAVVEPGSTYSITGQNGTSIFVANVNAKGGSQFGPNYPTGPGGGGGGTGTITALSAETYAADGCGAGKFVSGTGNAIYALGGNCYGASAPHTVEIGTDLTGKTIQIGYPTDYAGNVGTFRPGTDPLRIGAHLNGRTYASSGDFTSHCSVISGDTICDLGNNSTVVFKGTTGISAVIF